MKQFQAGARAKFTYLLVGIVAFPAIALADQVSDSDSFERAVNQAGTDYLTPSAPQNPSGPVPPAQTPQFGNQAPAGSPAQPRNSSAMVRPLSTARPLQLARGAQPLVSDEAMKWDSGMFTTDNGGSQAYLSHGIPETDAIGVSMSCSIGSSQVELMVIPLSAPGERFSIVLATGKGDPIYSNPSVAAEYKGYASSPIGDGGDRVVAVMLDTSDPVFAGIAADNVFRIVVNGRQSYGASLRQSAKATRRFVRLCSGAQASSFSGTSAEINCSRASVPAEFLICSVPELKRKEARMSGLYARLIPTLTAPEQSALRQEQRAWLRQRNACGGDEGCVSNRYDQRISVLQSVARQ